MFRGTFGAALVAAGSLAALPLLAPAVGDAVVGPAQARVRQSFTVGRTSTRVGSGRRRFVYRGRGAAVAAKPVAVPVPQPRPAPQPGPVAATPQPSGTAAPATRRDYSALTTASLAPPEALKEGMRPALEAKARTLATGSLGTSRPEPLPILLQPRSVTFDLEHGTRTVVYGDDIIVTDPYDAGRMRDLASPTGGAVPAGGATPAAGAKQP